ncbi:helix-turn-helix domain-containing protein [Streptomyces echinoruber]|uniref:Transcriptional regulator n=1 Tax=Streptomyces echinoruber TaxID=68898 RepID=A0A918R0J9_9ACTN|nr:helix-turn-helix transcriptional regulator [Streptomyces echinoruber]GGZ79489.1 transcriptional regulator [Streptomyces echinoruber]
MSGATGATGATGAGEEAEALAELLRELKERSGLSYGALAKRLHMSTSTLHRYCSGSAVPADYAPVERFARVCRASPEELVELHRRWILADAARGRKGPGPDGAARGAGAGEPGRAPAPDGLASGAGDRLARPAAPDGPPSGAAGPADASGGPSGTAGGTEPESASSGLREPGGSGEPLAGGASPSAPVRPRRRRTALIASGAAAAVLGAVALAAHLPSSGGDGGDRRVAEAAAPATGTGTGRANGRSPSASASPSPSRSGRTGTPSAPAPQSPAHGGGGAAHGGGGTARGGGLAAERTGGVPIAVAVRPYVYSSPCSQHFLVDSEPEQVGPPAGEQDAPRWAAAYGAVSSGERRVALTVQGTGKETVVLEALHVRVVAKGAPLAWNDYSMGVGCGGDVDTSAFDIDLDSGSPTVTVKKGRRDFPYKVSESDPEVFYLTARTKAHDVRWDLTLDWSSGNRRGTVHIDDGGVPFRTSADVGRPGYDYPLGGGEWIRREEQPGTR